MNTMIATFVIMIISIILMVTEKIPPGSYRHVHHTGPLPVRMPVGVRGGCGLLQLKCDLDRRLSGDRPGHFRHRTGP